MPRRDDFYEATGQLESQKAREQQAAQEAVALFERTRHIYEEAKLNPAGSPLEQYFGQDALDILQEFLRG